MVRQWRVGRFHEEKGGVGEVRLTVSSVSISDLLLASGEGPVELEVSAVFSLNEKEVAVAAAELSA